MSGNIFDGMCADNGRNKRSAILSTLKFAAFTAVTDDVLNALQGVGISCTLYEDMREVWILACSIVSLSLVGVAMLVSSFKRESAAERRVPLNRPVVDETKVDPRKKTAMGFSCWLLTLISSNVISIIGSALLIADQSNECGSNSSSTGVSKMEEIGNSLVAISTFVFPSAAQLGEGAASTMMLPSQ